MYFIQINMISFRVISLVGWDTCGVDNEEGEKWKNRHEFMWVLQACDVLPF